MVKKEKSLGDKLQQLGYIDQGGKLGVFQSLSNTQDKSKEELYHGMANNKPSALLENLFRNQFASRLPIGVDLNLFTIEKISQEEGLKMIDIIDNYLEGKYGGTNRGKPLHVYFEPDLIQFYYNLCKKSIFDVSELQKKTDFCVKYFQKTLFVTGREKECISNLEKLGFDKEKIFESSRDRINDLTDAYIESLYVDAIKHEKPMLDFESLKKELTAIVGSRTNGNLNVGKKIEDRVSFKAALSVFNELDIDKTKSILQQIRNIALKSEDYDMYTYVDRVTTLGKELKYNTSGSSVSLGIKNGKQIYAMLCDTGGKKFIFFDKDHYKKIDKENLNYGNKPSNFYEILDGVFPENMGIQKHDVSEALVQEQEKEKTRQAFEKKIGIPISALPGNASGFDIKNYKGRDIDYGFRKGFDFVGAKKGGEHITLNFNELDATTDGKEEIKDVSKEQVERMKGAIDEYIDQMNFFYKKIKEVGDKIYDFSDVRSFLKKDTDGNYCLNRQAKKGKSIYIVFDKNKNLFEIRDYKDVEIVEKEKTGDNVHVILPR